MLYIYRFRKRVSFFESYFVLNMSHAMTRNIKIPSTIIATSPSTDVDVQHIRWLTKKVIEREVIISCGIIEKNHS